MYLLAEGTSVRLFLSWSGERSRIVAHALYDLLPLVLYYVEPWFSEADIDAGRSWLHSLTEELAKTDFGIACITPENVNAPWILFEAGAMAMSPRTCKVIPLLVGVDARELPGPLALFQAQRIGQTGLSKVISSLQGSAGQPIPESRAQRLFDKFWPEFEKKLCSLEEEMLS
jgi:hypothetical protein